MRHWIDSVLLILFVGLEYASLQSVCAQQSESTTEYPTVESRSRFDVTPRTSSDGSTIYNQFASPAQIKNKESRTKSSAVVHQKVPTILGDTRPVEISLELLVLNSLTSRKTFANFNGAVQVDPSTSLDYAIAQQLQQLALSQFDPNITAFMIGNDINRPANSFFGPGLQQQSKIDEFEFNTRVSKTWENGLISSIGYEPSLAYLFFPQGNGSNFNPTHSSDLVTRIEQPLLRGNGRNVNLVNVRIAESRAQQSHFQIEAALQSQLRSIEQVYWRLHAEYVRLKAIDNAIELAQKTVDIVQSRFEAERVIYSDLARATVKLEDLYQQRLSAESAIRNASYDLAQLAGVELGDEILFVPNDEPVRQAPVFDANQIIHNAITFNPNLRRQRQVIAVQQESMIAAKNQILPKLNLQASHHTSGLQDDLGSALSQALSYRFNDYTLGLQYTQQFGMRQARSQLESSRLQIARERAILDALEKKVGFDLLISLNEVKQAFARYESALRQVEQSKKWVEIARIRYEDPPISNLRQESLLVTLADYQTALQAMIDSIVLVAKSLSDYNGSLALVDERRGYLLAKWHVSALNDSESIQFGSEPVTPPKVETIPTATLPPAVPVLAPQSEFPSLLRSR